VVFYKSASHLDRSIIIFNSPVSRLDEVVVHPSKEVSMHHVTCPQTLQLTVATPLNEQSATSTFNPMAEIQKNVLKSFQRHTSSSSTLLSTLAVTSVIREKAT
jgi:hypothetical protein